MSAPRPDRFPLMDALRGLAASAILVYHGVSTTANEPDGIAGKLARHLDLGVIVFFVITGTLLYRPFVANRLEGHSFPILRAYAARRALRIVPAYWVALLLAVPILDLGDVLTAGGVPKYFGFLQIYAPGGSGGLSQAWTLCIEVSFYVALPLLAIALARRPPERAVADQRVTLGSLFLAGLVWSAVAPQLFDGGFLVTALFSLPNFLDEFACGMALAALASRLVATGQRPAMVRWVERHGSACWVVALVAYIGLSLWVAPDPASDSAARRVAANVMTDLFAVAFVAPAVFGSYGGGLVRRLLGSPVLLRLGVVSYGVYLFHPLAYQLLFDRGVTAGSPLAVALALALTYLMAEVSWRVVEQPFLALKRRFRYAPPTAVPDAPASVASQARS